MIEEWIRSRKSSFYDLVIIAPVCPFAIILEFTLEFASPLYQPPFPPF